MNGQPIAMADLGARVVDLAASRDRHIVLSPDGRASVQDIVSVLDVLDGTGIPVHLARSH